MGPENEASNFVGKFAQRKYRIEFTSPALLFLLAILHIGTKFTQVGTFLCVCPYIYRVCCPNKFLFFSVDIFGKNGQNYSIFYD